MKIIFITDLSVDKEVPVKFWKSSTSIVRIRIRFALAEICTLEVLVSSVILLFSV